MPLYRSLHERLMNQHEAIAAIIEGLDETRLTTRPLPDKWSIHDNIAHLAKYQPVFTERVNAILHLHEPIFNAYRAEYDPDFETWRAWTTAKLLERLNSDRREISGLVNSLSDSELRKIGIHKKRGRLDLVQWTEFFVLHEAHHIRTIFELVHAGEAK